MLRQFLFLFVIFLLGLVQGRCQLVDVTQALLFVELVNLGVFGLVIVTGSALLLLVLLDLDFDLLEVSDELILLVFLHHGQVHGVVIRLLTVEDDFRLTMLSLLVGVSGEVECIVLLGTLCVLLGRKTRGQQIRLQFVLRCVLVEQIVRRRLRYQIYMWL